MHPCIANWWETSNLIVQWPHRLSLLQCQFASCHSHFVNTPLLWNKLDHRTISTINKTDLKQYMTVFIFCQSLFRLLFISFSFCFVLKCMCGDHMTQAHSSIGIMMVFTFSLTRTPKHWVLKTVLVALTAMILQWSHQFNLVFTFTPRFHSRSHPVSCSLLDW